MALPEETRGEVYQHEADAKFGSVPASKLGKPVSVWGDMTEPSGVTVNSMGKILVVLRKDGMIFFDKEGKKLKTIDHNLGWCSGIAVDSKDNIYCVDQESNKILRWNKYGRNLKVHEVKQDEGPGHWGLAVAREELMVSECNNNGTIMVYDSELKHSRKIAGRGMGPFNDMSLDCHGNVYATDSGNSVIRVFSINGDLLRSFGCDENGVKKLKNPWGVWVAGQCVYVTDGGLHNVSVFTTEGVYVTSIGHRGQNEGHFNFPHGICANKDGFVYVADYGNDKIQIF